MHAPLSCPSCGHAFAPGESTCPRDGTRAPGPAALGPNATMLDAEDDEALALEPTLIRKRKDLNPATTMDEDAVPADRTQKWDPLVGARLGEYVVEERIGTGGMGIVYRGQQPEIGKAVAIKVLRPEIADDPEQVRRLLAEARAVNAIGHRGIIDIFSFGRLPDGRQYFVMELLNGVPLDEKMARSGKLSAEETLSLLDDTLSALGAAHSAGVIHRDLKPSNLFLVSQPDGSTYLKLLDFGLARQSAIPGGSTPQTRNVAVGTAEYMAPEQARGFEVGPYTDLYSLGVVAYEMVTGRLPFIGASPVETIIAHLEKAPVRPSVYEPELVPELEELILRLLAKDPSDRPQTADAVRRELKRVSHALRGNQTQPAASRPPVPDEAPAQGDDRFAPDPDTLRPRGGPLATNEAAAALMAAELLSAATTTAPHATLEQPAFSAPPVAAEPELPRRATGSSGPQQRVPVPVKATLTAGPAYRPVRSARWPVVVTVVAVALTLALGIARYVRTHAPGPPPKPADPVEAEGPAVPVAALPPSLPPTQPDPPPRAPAPVADADPGAKAPESRSFDDPKRPKKARPVAAKRAAPTQGALLERIEGLRRELARATQSGEEVDPLATSFLARLANQARASPDEAARRKIAAGLDEIQRNFIAH